MRKRKIKKQYIKVEYITPEQNPRFNSALSEELISEKTAEDEADKIEPGPDELYSHDAEPKIPGENP